MMTKKTLIFLPALMTDHRLYFHQIEQMKDDFDIIVPIIKEADDIHQAALYVINLIEDTPTTDFHLIGTSMGGYIAMEIARLLPFTIQSMTLINTTWDIDTKEKKQQRSLAISEAESISDEKFLGISDKIISDYLYNNNEQNSTLIKNMVRDLGRQCFINQQKIILSRDSNVSNLSSYDFPTLVVSGAQDNITPTYIHKQMYKALPKGKLVVIDQCKHLSPIDQPIALTSLLKLWFCD